MGSHFGRFALSALALAALPGCQSISGPGELTPDSLLQAAESSPDAVTLDIYWARTVAGDADFEASLWKSVQEDRIPIETRYALAENGLRAGVVGGTPSEQILWLLNPDGKQLSVAADTDDVQAVGLSSKVSRRLLQLRPGRRVEVQAADNPRSISLLRHQDGGLVGRKYADAQGIYGLKVLGRDHDLVTLELTPELHHGQPRMRYTPSGPGMVVQRLARDSEVFSDVQMDVHLGPGEILIVSCLADARLCLGELFHRTDPDSGSEQKYLLVRLSQVPENQALAAADSSWPWK